MMIYGPYSAPVGKPQQAPNHRTGGATPPARTLDFADVLRREALTTQQPSGVRFSKHAEERLKDRGIELGPEDITRLNTAVDKAQGKGSRESVVLMDEHAFIVSVPPRTVVTVMDLQAMRESVVTNIDSFVWAGP